MLPIEPEGISLAETVNSLKLLKCKTPQKAVAVAWTELAKRAERARMVQAGSIILIMVLGWEV
jgi:hypothetical protein